MTHPDLHPEWARIDQRRQSAGLSWAELLRRSRLSYDTFTKARKGGRAPRNATVAAINHVLADAEEAVRG